MKYPLKVGVLTGPVTVGFVEKPDTVWVSLDAPREELMDRLEVAKLKKIENVQVGSVAATIFSEDEALYRVSVMSVSGTEVEVRYCDYGNVEKKVMGELFKLPEDLASEQQLAVNVRVEGVKGVADSSKNRARVEKKLSVEGLMVKLEEEINGLVGNFEVGGKKIKFSKNKDVTPVVEEKAESKVEECKIPGVKSEKKDEEFISNKVVVATKGVPVIKDVVAEAVVKSNKKEDELVEIKNGPVEDVVQVTQFSDVDVVVAKEVASVVKVPISSTSTIMFSELPKLKLLEGVEISGTVVYISPLGGVWFCPQWIQSSLDTLTVKVDGLAADNLLVNLSMSTTKEGMLCIARSPQDGELYRARVVSVDSKATVAFIDFGNSDVVSGEDLYELPPGLEMLAPASAEVVMARELPKQKTQQALEESLMEVENLILVLEMEETGAKVGKFYASGKEIKWNTVVEAKKMSGSDRVDLENNDEEDVVIESEIVKKEVQVELVANATEVASVEVHDVSVPLIAVVPAPIVELATILPKLIRLVPSTPFEKGFEVQVFVVHVESVKKVWVSRECDEVRVSLLMDKLARMSEELKPAQRMKKGAVYGTRFSEDGEMYRAVLRDVAGEGRINVQFIDFGNMEVKEEMDLLDIPEDVGTESAAAIAVIFENTLEDSAENRNMVEEKLGEDNLTVTVDEGVTIFKLGGEVVSFDLVASQNTSSLVASEEMLTMEDLKLPATTAPMVGVVDEVHKDESLLMKPSEVVAPPKNGPTVAASASTLPHAVHVPVCIPVPVVPQPVPTRTFAKAISALQSQLQVKPGVAGGKKEPPVAPRHVKETSKAKSCQWSDGDLVVARWPDGVWRRASIVEVNPSIGQAKVIGEGVEEAVVDLNNVRPHSLPVEALNLIDQGLVRNSVVRQKGDGESHEKRVLPAVVGKVKDWMDKNMAQLRLGVASSTQFESEELLSPPLEVSSKLSLERIPLPSSQELSGYSRTSKGSLHIQSVLNTSDVRLSTHILTSLLSNNPGPLSLMTSPKSSYVFQKLITVLPSPQLQPLLSLVLTYFTQLSLDSSGCRVVQSLLEFSSPDQQRTITSLLCNTKTLLTLAADRHGTYVAQACLPHLTPSPTALLDLVNCLLDHTAMLGQHQCGTFFLQRLVGVLSTHYPGSAAACLLQEDILSNLSQLVITEPGSRLVQVLVKDTLPVGLIRVARWVEENKKVVIVAKPAVYVGIAVLEQIVDRLGEEGSWKSLLERIFNSFLDLDKDSAERRSVMMTAAFHPVGHLLARDMVSKVNHVGEDIKMDMMRTLAAEVDLLSADKFGGIVLKGLVV